MRRVTRRSWEGTLDDDAGGMCDPRHPERTPSRSAGLVVEIGRVRILADRDGLLGALLASLTCGGASAADNLEAMAQMLRASDGSAAGSGPQQAQAPQPAAAS